MWHMCKYQTDFSDVECLELWMNHVIDLNKKIRKYIRKYAIHDPDRFKHSYLTHNHYHVIIFAHIILYSKKPRLFFLLIVGLRAFTLVEFVPGKPTFVTLSYLCDIKLPITSWWMADWSLCAGKQSVIAKTSSRIPVQHYTVIDENSSSVRFIQTIHICKRCWHKVIGYDTIIPLPMSIPFTDY